MAEWINDEGLIPARADDPPFFKDFRDRHNRRVEHRALRQIFVKHVKETITKIRQK